MSSTIIKVEDLGKLYRLGEIGTGTISHDLNRWWAKIRGKGDPFAKIGETNDRTAKGNSDYVWALKDINFEVKQGEILGIIGRNGAGKSTLLKILSKVTTPSTGNIKVKGRIASLLEVGTGFHPELTGRENIFLNGAILGMTKDEIISKFDAIVEFAGVERYIDTPVKRYSSGMYVRLAFSVAAHLESEILIVDEVLAVGDSVFQKKCIDKMVDIVHQGRTILFVSHNIASIKSLCNKGILLQNGQIIYDDIIENVIDKYATQNIHLDNEIDLTNKLREKSIRDLMFTNIKLEQTPIPFGEDVKFTVSISNTSSEDIFDDLDFGVAINDVHETRLIHISNRFINKNFTFNGNQKKYSFTIQNSLRPGIYSLELFLRAKDIVQDWIKGQIHFEIGEGNPYGFNDSSQVLGYYMSKFDINEII